MKIGIEASPALLAWRNELDGEHITGTRPEEQTALLLVGAGRGVAADRR
jgi:hypothetical protein